MLLPMSWHVYEGAQKEQSMSSCKLTPEGRTISFIAQIQFRFKEGKMTQDVVIYTLRAQNICVQYIVV